MAWQLDSYDNALVLDGFQNGIADDPYEGISDMRNINIISVPGEGSVNFATTKNSPSAISGSATSASASVVTYTGAVGLSNHMGVIFSATTLSGVSTNKLYLIGNLSGGTFKLYTDYGLSTQVIISGTGTGTFSVLNPTLPKHFTKDSIGNYWMIDASGYVWSNTVVDSNSNWTPAGNLPNNASNGNGLGFYQGTSTHGFIFAFSNSSIDYVEVTTPYTWQYQWDPVTGVAAGYGASPAKVLNTATGTANSHETMVPPDGHFYFCDKNYIDQFFQTSPGTAFDPTNVSTGYTYSTTQLLPYNDVANCLSFLGTNLMVGGLLNAVYPWDRVSNQFNYPILLPENIVWKMVTVNTNTYMFVGNRGRIYITNGTQANLFKKVPDHISGTIEPYFQWGGACFQKNQLYFSMSATTNGAVALTTYGGVWAIDLDTGGMRLAQKLSYGTYAGYSSAMIATTQTAIAGSISNPASNGSGLYIGWYDGISAYGIDQTTSSPYTSSQASIDFDLIPIGTFEKPRDFMRVEYLLTKPMVTGESITINYRLDFSSSYTLIFTDSTAGNYTNSNPVNFKNAKWIQIQAVLNSTASNPSYTRLRNVRLTGLVGPTPAGSPQLSL